MSEYIEDGNTKYSDPYIVIDTSIDLNTIDSLGQFFKLDLTVILAHELSHWQQNTSDPLWDNNHRYTNLIMNNGEYDYIGSAVRAEWTVSNELRLSGNISIGGIRASYSGALFQNDPRLVYLDTTRDYAKGYVDIVRFGDLKRNGLNQLVAQDDIDY